MHVHLDSNGAFSQRTVFESRLLMSCEWNRENCMRQFELANLSQLERESTIKSTLGLGFPPIKSHFNSLMPHVHAICTNS